MTMRRRCAIWSCGSADTLHPLAAGTHYVHDLQQCLVVTTSGAEIGRVTRVEFGLEPRYWS